MMALLWLSRNRSVWERGAGAPQWDGDPVQKIHPQTPARLENTSTFAGPPPGTSIHPGAYSLRAGRGRAAHQRCDRAHRSLYGDFSQRVHTVSCLIQRVTSLVVRVRRGGCVGKRTPSPCRGTVRTAPHAGHSMVCVSRCWRRLGSISMAPAKAHLSGSAAGAVLPTGSRTGARWPTRRRRLALSGSRSSGEGMLGALGPGRAGAASGRRGVLRGLAGGPSKACNCS